MNRSLAMSALAIAFGGALLCADVRAESQTEKYLGEREMCLEGIRIKESRVLDDQTILFEMRDGAIYICRLPAPCPGLWISGGFSYETSNTKLCKQEIIQVVETGSAPSSTCGMGEFVRFKQEGMLEDVMKLLEDGLLDALVEEGAFEEAFASGSPAPKKQGG